MVSQLVKLSNMPADKLARAMVENTIKSLTPCTLNFSSSLYVKTTKLVPEINKKFHPKPKNIRAAR